MPSEPPSAGERPRSAVLVEGDSDRAALLSRAGDLDAARAAYDQAIAACANDVERTHLTEKRAALDAQPRTSPG